MLYGLADCNNFYCSCERVFRPDLVGKPVVVLSNNDGCVIARSNESKALGIAMGTPFYQAKPLLEANNVAVFSSNYNLYGDMSRRVMSLLASFAPNINVYSIDEAFFDLSPFADPAEYARGMAAYIRRGTGIPISIGIAPTKTLAKVASKFAKKYPGYRGACAIDTPERCESALKLFDIADVWGIGRRHARRLNAIGVNTAYEFTQLSPEWVQKHMAVTGLRTWRELRGIDCISIDELPHKQSICTSRSFPGPGLNRLCDVEEALANFAASCSGKLRMQGTACRAMTIFAHTSLFREDVEPQFIQTTIHFPVATSALDEIVPAAVNALRAHWPEHPGHFKKAGAIVWAITPAQAVQGSLFDTIDRPRQERLQRAIDTINSSPTAAPVRLAVQGGTQAWHLKNCHLSRRFTTDLSQVIALKTR